MPKHRHERITERIRQELSEIITQELRDPRVGFVTVTHVKVAPDYTRATVFLSILGDEANERTTMRALEHARGHIQTELAQRIRIRRHPEIGFRIDEGFKNSQKVSRILSELEAEKGAEPAEPEAPADEPEGSEREP